MAKKINSNLVTRVKGAEQLKAKMADLEQKGYSIFCEPGSAGVIEPRKSWDDYVSNELRGGRVDDSKSRSEVPTLWFSSGNESKVDANDQGTPNLGWMEWGVGNRLPNVVSLLTGILPYTAAGVELKTNICAGLGPQPMYRYAQYIGGNVSEVIIPYQNAGVLLKGKLVDKQRELLNIQSEQGNDEDHLIGQISPISPINPMGQEEDDDPRKDLIDSLKSEIKQIKADYAEWERTNAEVVTFLQRNNLPRTWLALSQDEMMYNICYPELLLNQNDVDDDGKPVTTSQWNPKVTGIGFRTCHTTRLERMDAAGRINYVYCSNRWLDTSFTDQGQLVDPIKAIPALALDAPLQSLEKAVREARQKNLAPKKRPTRFVLPSIYPTPGRPYYPTPAWHSIFGGDIYEYLSTIISDRFNRKKNSNIIGRIIYLHNDYLAALFNSKKATGDAKKQEEIRNKVWKDINTWLSNRDNAGQSLIAFTFMGSDGKEHKSFEIVEVENSSTNSVIATNQETAEISSVVFMAMGLDARLLGSSPITLQSKGGGTDIRERLLMRQILMSPTTNIMLKALEVASNFNKWDSHLVWKIKREVMTTLDNSKTGVTEDKAN